LPVRLFFDHNLNQAPVHGLRLRGLDVVTAFEDGTHQLSDPDLLDRASPLGRLLVSSDTDQAIEARRRPARSSSRSHRATRTPGRSGTTLNRRHRDFQ
jgi:hypothetical protein